MYSAVFFVKEPTKLSSLRTTNIKLRELRDNEILIKNEYIGVNDIDYQQLSLHNVNFKPTIIGCESVGIVVKISKKNNSNFKEGDRVACCNIPFGAYSTYRIIPTNKALPVPKTIDPKKLMSFLYKAMYANSLVFDTYFLHKNIPILVTYPTKSVGNFICQYAKKANCKVISILNEKDTNSNIFVQVNNLSDLVVYDNDANYLDQIISYNNKLGLGAIFDNNVNNSIFKYNMKCLMTWGMYVLYDNLCGKYIDVSPNILRNKSLYFTSPSFFAQKNSGVLYLTSALGVIEDFLSNKITCKIYKEYNFEDAPKALYDLQQGKNIGSSIVLKV